MCAGAYGHEVRDDDAQDQPEGRHENVMQAVTELVNGCIGEEERMFDAVDQQVRVALGLALNG